MTGLPMLALLAACVAGIAPVKALEIEIETDNDYLTSNRTDDDLYTFAIELRIEHGSYTLTLRENSFTDREAGERFDETYLTVRRPWALRRSDWILQWEVGAAHVGRGLFGQSLQNAIHRLIDDPELDLRYPDSSELHPLLVLEAMRPFPLTRRFLIGPRLVLESALGFKSQLSVGARAIWKLSDETAVRLSVGPKLASSSLELLAAHLVDLAPFGAVEVELPRGFAATWSYNRYGTRRQHLSVSYRASLGPTGRADR